jgi:hypothetical protein
MTESKPVSNQTAVAAIVALSILLTASLLVQVAVLRELGGVQEELGGVQEELGGVQEELSGIRAGTESTAARVTEIGAKTPGFPAKWEYDVVSIGDLEWDSKGLELGSEGWEILTARRASDSSNNFSYECIVKRPKIE